MVVVVVVIVVVVVAVAAAAAAAAVGAGRDGIKGRGTIQGDGRKFLDRFKSYFGSQISSQSLNEVSIYQLQPKSATKGEFFQIFMSLIVSSWRHGLQMANEAYEKLLGKRLL